MNYPPTAAPMKKRQPFDLTKLPPEMQQRIAAEGSITFEDGSAVYADGTATGAGDSAGDYAMDGAMSGFDMGSGGWTSAPQFSGPPTAAPESMTDEPGNPLGGPLFRRYRQTANAPFPGTPGGVGGGPVDDGMMGGNPMGDALPNPFETAEVAESPTAHVPALPPSASPPEGALSRDEPKPGGYQGRVGRRMQSRQQTRPGSRPMGGRRRR